MKVNTKILLRTSTLKVVQDDGLRMICSMMVCGSQTIQMEKVFCTIILQLLQLVTGNGDT